MMDIPRSLLLIVLLACSLNGFGAAVEVPAPVRWNPRIDVLVAPLSGAPAIRQRGETLVLEFEQDVVSDQVEITFRPSFGQARVAVPANAPGLVERSVLSALWPDRRVDRVVVRVPEAIFADLHDIEVRWDGGGKTMQRRALSVVDRYSQAPRVVVIADPSVGDPRPVVDALNDALSRGEIAELLTFVQRSVGNPASAERWAAFARVIREVNLLRPDFVLVTGDLTFLLHTELLPYEYDDAWRLLDRLEVPAFVTPGNHDLYAIDDYLEDAGVDGLEILDGRALWQRFFGPLHYSVDIGPDLHLVSLNTFDWPRFDPFPLADQFDTLAGGQVGEAQRRWLVADLEAYRARSPSGNIVTIAHHDPSWLQRRHSWIGEGRLEVRDAMAAFGVGVHFSGHTHEDRVARFFQGDIVETNGRPHVDHPVRELHLLKRDGSLDTQYSQSQLADIVLSPEHGPLFVSTTTASSQLVGETWGLGGYWGYRLATLAPQSRYGGYDPVDFGYPASDEFLIEHAERPENWTAAHSPLGVFSYPSFELSAQPWSGGNSTQISNNLDVNVAIYPRFSLELASGQVVESSHGRVAWVRRDGATADVLVATEVAPREMLEIQVWARDQAHAETSAVGVPQRDADDFLGNRGGAVGWLYLLSCVCIALARRVRRCLMARELESNVCF